MNAKKPVTIRAFKGMNNVIREGGFAGHDDGTITAIPKVILNADVTAEEKLKKRQGYSLLVSLPNSHSAWSKQGVMLTSSMGRLYRFYPGGSTVNLCAISGPFEAKLSYAKEGDLVYISSAHWMGILNSQTNAVSAWGIPIPEQPVLSLVEDTGVLEPGRYQLCYTNLVDGMVGGNGMISEIEVTAANSRIVFLNKPVGAIAWATDPNGDTFFRIGREQGYVTDIDTTEPLPTFLCYPPSPMRFIRVAFGRMWGAINNLLVYSEPYRYDLYKSTNRFVFPSEIRMVAFVDGGIYVGFEDRTVFLPGTEPSGMKEVSIAGGVSKNIFAYCNNVPDMGNNIPVWVSADGLVAGSHGGQLAKITHNKVQFPAGEEGAAVSRIYEGREQFIASFKQQRPTSSGIGMGDSATCEVVRNGRVITT